MITKTISLAAALAFASVTGAGGAEMRDRITPEQMRQRQGQALARQAQLSAATPQRHPKTKPAAPRGIIEQSTILVAGGYWTLVPRGSVLHAPEKLRAHIAASPSGIMLPWRYFITRNHGWLSTEELSLETAAGLRPITPSTVLSFERRGRIVVAVHRGGPVSVRQPSTDHPAAEVDSVATGTDPGQPVSRPAATRPADATPSGSPAGPTHRSTPDADPRRQA
jgi:hypothetical protein